MSGIVNAYRQKSAEAVRHALVITLLLAIAPAWAASQSDERSVKPVTFAKGKSSATITGRIEGRRYIDHTLRAAAGRPWWRNASRRSADRSTPSSSAVVPGR